MNNTREHLKFKTAQMQAVHMASRSENEHSEKIYEHIEQLIASFGQKHLDEAEGGEGHAQGLR